MYGKSGEEVGSLSGLSEANKKGMTKADANGLKPNSPCCQPSQEDLSCLLARAAVTLAGPGTVLALSSRFVHLLPTLPECPHPSGWWEGARWFPCL